MASNWKLLNRVWHANLGMAAGFTLGLIALSCPFIAHKWEAGKFLMKIHYGEFLPKETRWIWIDSQGLLLAFLIGSGWLMHRKAVKKAASVAADDPAVAGSSVTVLGLGDPILAKSISGQAESRGLRAFGCEAEAFAALDLTLERWLVIAPSGAMNDEAFRKVLAHVTALKPGALKRLEFAIGPGLQADQFESLEQGLRAGGAKPMKLPAAEGDWAARVTAHLCAQSVSLASRRKAAPPTKPSAVAASPSLAAGGYTLVEMLCVLTVLALLVGGVSTALGSYGRRENVHSAAREFAALVREARQTARREGAMVRLSLLTPDTAKEAGLEEIEQRTSCGLYIFRTPATRLPAALVAPSAPAVETDRKLNEAAMVSRVPLIEELIGGWESAPGHGMWRKWTGISLDGDIFETMRHGGFPGVREAYLWHPESTWSREPGGSGESAFSIYPRDFSGVPYPAIRKTVVATLNDASSVVLAGAEVKATDIWGTSPVARWPKRDAGPASMVCYLPALDFLPDGSLACAATHDQIRFRFSGPDGGLPEYFVVIDTREGNPWIQ